MPKPPILQENQSYTFRSYFEMPYEPDEILAEFNYSLSKLRLSLPRTTRQLDRLQELQQRIEDSLSLVSLSSETARRETLVAPLLLERRSSNRDWGLARRNELAQEPVGFAIALRKLKNFSGNGF